MAIAMVAMLAFGGTYAYFTASTNSLSEGTITTGKIQLTTNATTVFTTDVTNLFPGDKVFDEGLSLSTAQSTGASYVAIQVTTEGSLVGITIDVDGKPIADDENVKWVKISDSEGVAVYVLAKSEADAFEVADGSTISVYATGATLATTPDYNNAEGQGHAAMGATMKISVVAKSIQAKNFGEVPGAATAAEVVEALFA